MQGAQSQRNQDGVGSGSKVEPECKLKRRGRSRRARWFVGGRGGKILKGRVESGDRSGNGIFNPELD